ncbi:Chloroperoxidase [Phytophthora cactorum]|nr:Chloroperoxidase [Phytophthora cactorum]
MIRLPFSARGLLTDYLGRHVLPEHDASLVRTDVYFGHDPMEINSTLAEDFLTRADASEKINTTAVAHTRRDRVTMCEAINPECTFGANEKQTAFLQAALLLTVTSYLLTTQDRSYRGADPQRLCEGSGGRTVATLTAKYVELVSQAP